jgi:hypothetical protein
MQAFLAPIFFYFIPSAITSVWTSCSGDKALNKDVERAETNDGVIFYHNIFSQSLTVPHLIKRLAGQGTSW